MEPPSGWAKDDLTKFFDLARNNQFASFLLRSGPYGRLRDLDQLWLHLAEHLDNPVPWYPTFFYFRSHSGYRAACELALAGYVPETYMLLRGTLEFALYGYFIAKHPQHWDTWANRHDDEASKRAMRNTFTVRAVMDTLAEDDSAAGAATQALYDRCIDIGGHPNPQALFGSMTMTEDPDAIHFETTYLAAGNTPSAELAIRSVAQIGVCSFGIFGLIYKTRCNLLGLWEKLEPIRRGL